MTQDFTGRHDWTRAEAEALYAAPFNDLLFDTHSVHRRHFDPNNPAPAGLRLAVNMPCLIDNYMCAFAGGTGDKVAYSAACFPRAQCRMRPPKRL